MERLSDIMSHTGLHGYAEVALILFFVAFVAIVVRVFAPSRKREMDDMARKPLEDERSERPKPGAHA